MASFNVDKLIKECLKQNRKAQKELYDRFAPQMLGICYRYTKSMDDAENILQEGFVKVFFRLEGYRGEGDLGAWIRRVMINTALTYLKTNKQYREEMFFDEDFMHPVSNENPEVNLSVKDLTRLIRQLPTGFQTIFNLRAGEGYTHKEISEMLGISEGTSRSQYARARALLIEWLKQTYYKEQGGHYGK